MGPCREAASRHHTDSLVPRQAFQEFVESRSARDGQIAKVRAGTDWIKESRKLTLRAIFVDCTQVLVAAIAVLLTGLR
jgi:hypothetical protein